MVVSFFWYGPTSTSPDGASLVTARATPMPSLRACWDGRAARKLPAEWCYRHMKYPCTRLVSKQEAAIWGTVRADSAELDVVEALTISGWSGRKRRKGFRPQTT
jgi:hypothetical protein